MKHIIMEFINELKINLKEYKANKNLKKQIPNLLTLSRGIAPIIIIPLICTGNIIPAIIITILVASTDFFDGLLARRYDCVSDFGKQLDPICDKILAIGIAIPIAILSPIFWWNVILEIVISAINIKSKLNGNNPKSTVLGKIKTGFLSINILIFGLSLTLNIPPPILYGILSSTVLLQSASALQYEIIDNKKDREKRKIIRENKKQIIKEEFKTKENDLRTEIQTLKYLRESLMEPEITEKIDVKKIGEK